MCIGNGKLVTLELEHNRLITIDLDCEDDWGEINIDEDGISIGNEEDGYTKVLRVFEELERDDDDPITSRYQTFAIVAEGDFIEWYLVRTMGFSCGYTLADLTELLAEFDIDINNIVLPECVWDYLTDEEKKRFPYIKD